MREQMTFQENLRRKLSSMRSSSLFQEFQEFIAQS